MLPAGFLSYAVKWLLGKTFLSDRAVETWRNECKPCGDPGEEQAGNQECVWAV